MGDGARALLLELLVGAGWRATEDEERDSDSKCIDEECRNDRFVVERIEGLKEVVVWQVAEKGQGAKIEPCLREGMLAFVRSDT